MRFKILTSLEYSEVKKKGMNLDIRAPSEMEHLSVKDHLPGDSLQHLSLFTRSIFKALPQKALSQSDRVQNRV